MSNSDELLQAIRQISQGRRYISANIAMLFVPDTKSISASKLTPLGIDGVATGGLRLVQQRDHPQARHQRKHREMAADAIRLQGTDGPSTVI